MWYWWKLWMWAIRWVIKESEVLVTCSPVTSINQKLQAWIIESSDTLISEILHSAELNAKHRSASERLLLEFRGLFSRMQEDVGWTKIMQYRIYIGNHLCIKQHLKRLQYAKQKEVSILLTEMLQKDVIESSKSSWTSPIVLFQKKNGLHKILHWLSLVKNHTEERQLPSS